MIWFLKSSGAKCALQAFRGVRKEACLVVPSVTSSEFRLDHSLLGYPEKVILLPSVSRV